MSPAAVWRNPWSWACPMRPSKRASNVFTAPSSTAGSGSPRRESLINLAPADVKKAGPAFDLPIALGTLIGEGVLAGPSFKEYVIVGELALDGRVRPVNGVLSMAMTAAASGFTRMIVPLENAKEAAVVQEIEVFGVGSLAQAVGFLSGQLPARYDRDGRR